MNNVVNLLLQWPWGECRTDNGPSQYRILFRCPQVLSLWRPIFQARREMMSGGRESLFLCACCISAPDATRKICISGSLGSTSSYPKQIPYGLLDSRTSYILPLPPSSSVSSSHFRPRDDTQARGNSSIVGTYLPRPSQHRFGYY